MQQYSWESFALLKALGSSILLSGKVENSLCIAISSTSNLGNPNAAGIAVNTVAIVKELWWCFGPFVYDDLNDGGYPSIVLAAAEDDDAADLDQPPGARCDISVTHFDGMCCN